MNKLSSKKNAELGELQSHVQRQLGRCMLCLQQYEALLKKMLPYASYFGRPSALPSLLAEASELIGTKTLGALVGMLTETVLRPDDLTSRIPENDSLSAPDAISVSSRTQLVFVAENYMAIKAGLKELVALRNMLVHEFLAKFDLRRLDGCIAAEAFLSKSLESINAHVVTLRNWTQTMTEARALMSSTLGAPAFKSFLHDGIAPDGTIHWGASGIVAGLRDAEADLALNGWTPLESAIAWMGRHAPEQNPKRYGCNSWRQVLHKSRQFDVFKKPPIGVAHTQKIGGLRVWYRSRKRPLDT